MTSFVGLRNLLASSKSPFFQATAKNLDDTCYAVSVSSKAGIHIGSYRFGIEIVAELATGETVVAKELQVMAEIVSDIQASPPMLHFGARSLGETCEETISLYSLTGVPVHVIDQRPECEGLTVEPMVQPRSEKSASFLVRQRICGAGNQTGKLVFSVQSDTGTKSEVPIIINYHGSNLAETQRLSGDNHER
ncbi:MAG: hypothetical protein L0215_23145 [Gemmataceae bacterium]|nr:hypothetical protein [Gemmataceae bacterium]